MTPSRSTIAADISWFNQEIDQFKSHFLTWLSELGHTADESRTQITNTEEPSGPYETARYALKIDNSLDISIKPVGIWLIGAKGRIDVLGPSGSEKFIFLSTGGPSISTDIKDPKGNIIENRSRKLFKNVNDDGWYWYDDSSYRKMTRFSKEIIEPLLERLQ